MSRRVRAAIAHATTRAWAALVLLTIASAAIAVAERGVLPWIGWLIAALVAFKAHLVAEHYLEVADAAPVFRRIVRVFIGLVPVALAVTGWLESR